MKKILIAGLAAFSMALITVATVPSVRNDTVTATTAAGVYSQAHVLQPGSRGSVVEI